MTGEHVGDGIENGNGHARRPRRMAVLIAAICAVAVAVAAAVVYGCQSGLIVPNGTAAKYDGMNYIAEQDVSDYIASYRKSVGYEESDDAAWATYLASVNQNPQSLRMAAVKQFVIDAMVAKEAASQGVAVTDDELAEYVDSVKGNLAFGDDDIFAQTLEAHGQTVEQAEASYRSLMLQDKLFEKVVEKPNASEEQVKSYLEQTYPNGVNAKHVYLFTINGFDEEGSYAKFARVQDVREVFARSDKSKKAFAALLQTYSNDDDLISRQGANGWSLDVSDYSEKYQEAVEELKVGEVSEVFNDTSGYSFIWIDRDYTMPAPASKGFDFDKLPKTLREYFEDSASYVLWQDACQEHLEELYANSDTVIYAMPADVPYNVDMSLAEDSDGVDGSGGASE